MGLELPFEVGAAHDDRAGAALNGRYSLEGSHGYCLALALALSCCYRSPCSAAYQAARVPASAGSGRGFSTDAYASIGNGNNGSSPV